VLIDVIAVDVMQVTIMKIVGMPVVAYGHVPAARTVGVAVCGMRLTFSFLHAPSFLSGMAISVGETATGCYRRHSYVVSGSFFIKES
jgi:hypothetical protein